MQTMPIIKERGHLLVSLGTSRAIIDTGSPTSMSPAPFDFVGQRQSPPSSIMGVTPQKMSDLSGIRIDILIGCEFNQKNNNGPVATAISSGRKDTQQANGKA